MTSDREAFAQILTIVQRSNVVVEIFLELAEHLVPVCPQLDDVPRYRPELDSSRRVKLLPCTDEEDPGLEQVRLIGD